MKYNSSSAEIQARCEEAIRRVNEEILRRMAARAGLKSAIQLEAEKGLIIEGTVNDQAYGSR